MISTLSLEDPWQAHLSQRILISQLFPSSPHRPYKVVHLSNALYLAHNAVQKNFIHGYPGVQEVISFLQPLGMIEESPG